MRQILSGGFLPKPTIVPNEDILPMPEEDQRKLSWDFALACLKVPPVLRRVPLTLELPEQVAEWRGDPWSVTIIGPTGSGKSWLAVRLLGRVFGNEPLHSRFWDASELLEEIRREIGTPDDGYAIDSALKAPGIVLDDFGAERDSAFARDKLGLILRGRYNRLLPTIITTNAASVADLAAIDPRIGSRLSEGIILPLSGRDLRVKNNQRRGAKDIV